MVPFAFTGSKLILTFNNQLKQADSISYLLVKAFY